MTISEVYKILEIAAKAQPNIHTIADEFLSLNRENTVYSAIVIQERDHQMVGDFMNYSFYIGYVDRLVDDKSNEIDIHSTGIGILNNIINGIKKKCYPTIDISTGRYFTFNERFTAECAGVYTDIILSVPVSDCPDFDLHFTDVDVRPAVFRENGVYEAVGFDGFSKVTIEVAPGELRPLFVKENGEYEPEDFYGFSKVVVDVKSEIDEEWVKNYTYSKDETDSKITDVRNDIPTKVSQLTNDAGYLTEHQDISNLATKEEVKDVEDKIPSLDGYATESWVENKGYLTEHQSLEEYAKKTDIPSLDGYATKSWVESKGYLTEHQDISQLATKSELKTVEDKIPSLDGYATESYVDTKVGEIVVPSLDGYATESWVESKGYLTEHQSLEEYAKKTDIPSLTGYATESYVDTKVGEIVIYLPELDESSSEEELESVYDTIESNTDAIYKFDNGNLLSVTTYPTTITFHRDNTLITQTINRKFIGGVHYELITETTDLGAGNVLVVDINEDLDFDTMFSNAITMVKDESNGDVLARILPISKDDCKIFFSSNGNEWKECTYTDLPDYVTNYFTFLPYIEEHSVGYATQSWVEGNDYIKRSQIDDKWNIECTTSDKSIKAKLDFTPSSTNDNKNFASLGTVRNFYNDTIHKGDIWSGTQAQWDALTDEQKQSYIIALITE